MTIEALQQRRANARCRRVTVCKRRVTDSWPWCRRCWCRRCAEPPGDRRSVSEPIARAERQQPGVDLEAADLHARGPDIGADLHPLRIGVEEPAAGQRD